MILAGAMIVIAALAGCQTPDPGATRAPVHEGAAARGSPTREALEGATYDGIEVAGGPVTLAHGRWEGKPFAEGSASRPVVILLEGFELTGDLQGDGLQEAVVLLSANAGGSGDFLQLAVVGGTDDPLRSIHTAPIGDRAWIRSARIQGGRVILDVVQAGPADASCCPGDLVTRTWELKDGQLAEAPPVAAGRLSPQSFAGTEWVLERWNEDEAAPGDPRVSLRLEDGRLAGSSGCNNYVSQVKAGHLPGALALGPVAGTKKTCAGAAMETEDRFLRQLGGVKSFRFVLGRLGLEYELAGNSGTMLFRAQPQS